MRVWFVNLYPEQNAFGFCYQRNILGIGWNLDKVLDKVDGMIDYSSIPENQSYEKFLLKESVTAPLAMEYNDLVWTQHRRSHGGDGRFYLGRINDSIWEDRRPVTGHSESKEYRAAGILFALPCQLYQVRVSDIGRGARRFLDSVARKLQRRMVQATDNKEFVQNTRKIWRKVQK